MTFLFNQVMNTKEIRLTPVKITADVTVVTSCISKYKDSHSSFILKMKARVLVKHLV